MKPEIIHLEEMQKDPKLGVDIDAVLLVKWTNQRYHDDNLRSMFSEDWDSVRGISRKNAGRHRNQYYSGLLLACSLGVEYINLEQSEYAENIVQPSAIDIQQTRTVIASGNQLLVRRNFNDTQEQKTIVNPWFARLHAAETTARRNTLTVSSAFDQIFEVDDDGNIIWEMDIWATGRNKNKLGYTMSREDLATEFSFVNPGIELLKTSATTSPSICHITDPTKYGGLGLLTNLTPAFVNSLSQLNEDQILATSFHYGEGWLIDKNSKQVSVKIRGLKNPHGFIAVEDGFMITDTGNEAVHFLDPNMRTMKILDISCMKDRKQGLEKVRWLQNTVQLTDEVFATFSSPRQKITLFDRSLRYYRDIQVDPDWGLQTLASAPL